VAIAAVPVVAEDPSAPWQTLPLVTAGTIDPAWKHLWGGAFSVAEDGSLRTDCTDAGMGLLLYQKQRFGDCQIRVVYRCEQAKSNAGIYVRIDDGILEHANDPLPLRERNEAGRLTKESLQRIEQSSEAEREAWYPVHHGYEVQICDTADEFHRTGAIYSLAPAAAVVYKPPTDWKTMLITLDGDRILVDVDGERLTTFDPGSPDVPPRKHWSEPRREPKRPRSGFIGLQNHDPGDVVYFKEVSVRSLSNTTDSSSTSTGSGPFDGKKFVGRIAYDADGNFNDPDDWIASPVALAIFAEAGLKDQLVHFSYNNILPRNNPEWQRIHADSVQGAAQHYGFDLSRFHDCQRNLDAAVASIAAAIDASSEADPLYFIVAGPMEVPYLGIQKSDPAKRKHVYCISHSRWNDGFSSAARHDFFTHSKRSVIESGVNWVQIQDQNQRLSFGRYGNPAKAEEFAPYFWLRDSQDARLQFLWERMLVSTRPDPSDAGMAWFLVTGDEACDPDKLKQVLDGKTPPKPTAARAHIRIEAENFLELEGCRLEDRNDRNASHRLNVTRSGDAPMGHLRTRFVQPYAAPVGCYDIDVRYLVGPSEPCRFTLLLNGTPLGEPFVYPSDGDGWVTHTIRDISVRSGDQIGIDINGAGRVDYVQFNRQGEDSPSGE